MKFNIQTSEDLVPLKAQINEYIKEGKLFQVRIVEPKRLELQAFFEICCRLYAVIVLEKIPSNAEVAWQREVLKVECGHFKHYMTPSGETKMPRSMIELESVKQMMGLLKEVENIFDSYGMPMPDSEEFKTKASEIGNKAASLEMQKKYLQMIINRRKTDF